MLASYAHPLAWLWQWEEIQKIKIYPFFTMRSYCKKKVLLYRTISYWFKILKSSCLLSNRKINGWGNNNLCHLEPPFSRRCPLFTPFLAAPIISWTIASPRLCLHWLARLSVVVVIILRISISFGRFMDRYLFEVRVSSTKHIMNIKWGSGEWEKGSHFLIFALVRCALYSCMIWGNSILVLYCDMVTLPWPSVKKQAF